MKIFLQKICIIFLFVVLPLFLNAQISIQYGSVNQYLFSTKECLNLNATNLGQKAVEVQFIGKIDLSDNSKVLEFKSNPVILNPGVNILNALNLSFKDLNYLNNDIYEIETKTGTFPSGNYKLCIWSMCSLPDCAGQGSGAGSTEQVECVLIQVENPTPLLLSYPENNSEIDETRPLYTWIPPGPIASSSELNYLMRLVEVNDGQTPSDALLINRPLIEVEGLTSNAMMHPSDINALEPGKTYAWQVQAFVGKTYFSKSEQWKFKIKKEELVKDTSKYIKVIGGIDAAEHMLSEDGYLYFVFKDQKPNYTLDCRLLDASKRVVNAAVVEQGIYDTVKRKDVFSTVISCSKENKYRINAGHLKLPSGYYFIEIISSRRDKLLIKFKIN